MSRPQDRDKPPSAPARAANDFAASGGDVPPAKCAVAVVSRARYGVLFVEMLLASSVFGLSAGSTFGVVTTD